MSAPCPQCGRPFAKGGRWALTVGGTVAPELKPFLWGVPVLNERVLFVCSAVCADAAEPGFLERATERATAADRQNRGSRIGLLYLMFRALRLVPISRRSPSAQPRSLAVRLGRSSGNWNNTAARQGEKAEPQKGAHDGSDQGQRG